MPEKRFVTLCGECKHFKAFADPKYGECTQRLFGAIIVKKTDYCSYAEIPLPTVDDHDKSGLLEE